MKNIPFQALLVLTAILVVTIGFGNDVVHAAEPGDASSTPTESKESDSIDPSSLPFLSDSDDFNVEEISVAINGVTPLQRLSGDGSFWAVRALDTGGSQLGFYREGKWTPVELPDDLDFSLKKIKTICPGADDYILIGPSIKNLLFLKGTKVLAKGSITKLIEWHTDHFHKAFGPGTPFTAPEFRRRQYYDIDITSNQNEVWIVRPGLPRTLHIYAEDTWISTQNAFSKLSNGSGGTTLLWPGPNHEYVCAITPNQNGGKAYLASLDDKGEFHCKMLPRSSFFRGSKFVREGKEATWTSPGQGAAQRLDKNGKVSRFTQVGIPSLYDQAGHLWFTYPYGRLTGHVYLRKVSLSDKGEAKLDTIKELKLPGIRTLNVEQLPDGSFLAAIRLPAKSQEKHPQSYPALLRFTLDDNLNIKDSKSYVLSKSPEQYFDIVPRWSYSPQGFLYLIKTPSSKRRMRDHSTYLIITPKR